MSWLTSTPFAPSRIPNDDDALLASLAEVDTRPIFIVGLHRSGTTFLYESLSRALPLAVLTVGDIIFYPRLLRAGRDGRRFEDSAALDGYLSDRGVSTRGVDGIRINHATVEEYGWFLYRYCSTQCIDDESAGMFDELVRKLTVSHPGAEGVLFKSPWDTGHADRILARYPEARFIFIARDPVEILDSRVRLSLYFSSTPSPYLDLLLDGHFGDRTIYRLLRVGHALTPRVLGWWLTRRLMRETLQELSGYRRSWEVVPPSQRLEVSYADLTRQPLETITGIGQWLGLEITSLPDVESAPRDRPLCAPVAAAEARFRESLDKAGLQAA